MSMKRNIFFIAALFAGQAVQAQNGPCVIPGRGYFRIHVGTGGLFGAFAHDHLIEAAKIGHTNSIGADWPKQYLAAKSQLERGFERERTLKK